MSRTIKLRAAPACQQGGSLGALEEWQCSTRINLAAGSIHERSRTGSSDPAGTYTVPDDWPRFFNFGGMDLPVPELLTRICDWEEWSRSYSGWLVYGINENPLAAHAFEEVAPPVPLESLSVVIDPDVSLNVLSSCPDITHLHLPNLGESPLLGNLSQLRHLKSLKLRLKGGQQDLGALACLQSLTKLEIDVSAQNQPMDLRPLAALTQLEELGLRHFSQQQDYTPLAGLTNLHTLDLRHSFRLSDLTPLSGLLNLTHLNLSGSMGIVDLRPLRLLAHLEELNLSACFILENIGPPAGLLNLESLSLAHCERIADFTPLTRLLNLRALQCENCWRMQPAVREAVEDRDFDRFRTLLARGRS